MISPKIKSNPPFVFAIFFFLLLVPSLGYGFVDESPSRSGDVLAFDASWSEVSSSPFVRQENGDYSLDVDMGPVSHIVFPAVLDADHPIRIESRLGPVRQYLQETARYSLRVQGRYLIYEGAGRSILYRFDSSEQELREFVYVPTAKSLADREEIIQWRFEGARLASQNDGSVRLMVQRDWRAEVQRVANPDMAQRITRFFEERKNLSLSGRSQGETLLVIPAPEYFDGNHVLHKQNVSFGVSGDTLALNLENAGSLEFPLWVDPSFKRADADADVILNGQSKNDLFGFSVATAGDFNNDGLADVIVGAYSDDNNSEDHSGSAFIFLGRAPNSQLTLRADAQADVIIDGQSKSDGFGFSVASAGKFNNDSFDDVIIGAPFDDNNAQSMSEIDFGSAFIFYGRTVNSPLTLRADADADVIINGQSPKDRLGWAVAGAGDFDNNGRDDVIVGAPLDDNNGEDDSGSAFIFLGEQHMSTNQVTLRADADANVILDGQSTGDEISKFPGFSDQFGYSVAGVGDFNNDGRDDVIVGAPGDDNNGTDAFDDFGAAFVFFGQDPGVGQVSLRADANADVIINGTGVNDNLGFSVAGAGNFNGDNFQDVIVGAPFDDNNSETNSGAAFVVFGSSPGSQLIVNADTQSDVIINGQNAHDNLGWSVAGAGDLDGDGMGDVIVGSHFDDNNTETNSGSAAVFLARNHQSGTQLTRRVDTHADIIFDGQKGNPVLTEQGDNFGVSVASAGDFNGDGIDDAIVGAWLDDNNSADNSGSAFIFYGLNASFNMATSNVLENVPMHTVDVSLNIPNPLNTPVGVNFAVTGGTAGNGGVDYNLSSGTLTFNPGEQTKQITVSINTADTTDEPNETIVIGLSSPTSTGLGVIRSHTVTLIDNDNGPTVYFPFDTSENSESSTTVNLPVALSNVIASPVNVNFSVTGGTATAGAGQDFVVNTSSPLTFPPGSNSQNINITINNDSLHEIDETFEITLSSPVNATLGVFPVHTHTIEDNDANLPNVQFSSVASSASEATSPATLTVNLSAASGRTVTVDYAVTAESATNQGIDYTLIDGVLTFNPGETSKNLPVIPIVQDTLDEQDEIFQVTLRNPSHATLGTNSSHVYTITDDDAILPVVEFSAANSNGLESVTAVDLPVTLSIPSGQEVTVDYAISGSTTATGGGTDFTLANGTLTFPAGDQSENISIVINDDFTVENPDEIIVVTLSNASNATLGSTLSHTYTIVDNDSNSSVFFDSVTLNGSEGTSPVNIPVSLSNALPSDTLTVDFAVTGGTATGSGTDFTLANGTLTFVPNDTQENITVTLNNDSIEESDETIIITLSNVVTSPTGGEAVLSGANVHTFTIEDDDGTPEVQFDLFTDSGAESTTPANLAVSLSNGTSNTVMVDFEVIGGTATGGGTDFNLTAGTLTFNPFVTTQNIPVTIVNESAQEPDESFVVKLSNPVNATVGTRDNHTYHINNDDTVVAFNGADSAGAESTTAATIPLVLTTSVPDTVTVDFAVTGGTATGGGNDFTLASGTVTFNPGETAKNINFTVVDDGDDEPNETVQVTLSNPATTPNGGNVTLGATTVHTYTINDNDGTPSVAFDVATSNATESTGSASLNVDMTNTSASTVTVDFAIAGGSATGGGVDFTLASGTLTYASGELHKTIPLSIINDAVLEPDETIAVMLSNPSNAQLGVNQIHTYTIDNDDTDLTFAGAATSGMESTTAVDIEVVLAQALTVDTVNVDYAVTGGTATNAVDFTMANGTLSFAPGETSKNISLTVINDTIDEPNQTIIISLSNLRTTPNAGNVSFGANSVHTYTINDDDQTPSVAFDLASNSAAESVPMQIVRVMMENPSDSSVTVDYDITGGTAGSGTDFSLATPGTLTFNPGETSKDLTLTVFNDNEIEPDEPLNLQLSNPSNANLGIIQNHAFTISNDDSFVFFNAGGSNANESTNTVNIPVDLNQASISTVQVDYAVNGGTAGRPGDFLLNNGTLTFAPSETSKNISLNIVNDLKDEPNETVVLALLERDGGNGNVNGGPTAHTFTILDNDSPTLKVTGPSGLFSFGQAGGPFSPNSMTYQLTNSGNDPIGYSVSKTQNWTTLSNTGGTLNGGETHAVTVSLNSNADVLNAGSQTDTITFTNLVDGMGNTTRLAHLFISDTTSKVNLPPMNFAPKCFDQSCINTFQTYSVTNLTGTDINMKIESSRDWLEFGLGVPDSDQGKVDKADLPLPSADPTLSGSLPAGATAVFSALVNSNVTSVTSDDQADIIVTDTGTGELLANDTVALDVAEDPFGADSAFVVVAPYWQADAGSYTFMAVSHPSLTGMNSEIGVVVNAVLNGGGNFGLPAEFDIRPNTTQKVFIVSTNNPAVNPTLQTDGVFIIGTTNTSHGSVVVTPKAADPLSLAGNAGAQGRGYPDIRQLHFWGAVVVQSSATGFAMEFIGDNQDSRAFNTPNFSGLN